MERKYEILPFPEWKDQRLYSQIVWDGIRVAQTLILWPCGNPLIRVCFYLFSICKMEIILYISHFVLGIKWLMHIAFSGKSCYM